MRKYEITDNSKYINGRQVHQIRSLVNFSTHITVIREGDLGGWVQYDNNLSHDGTCWISDDVCLFGDSRVRDDASIWSNQTSEIKVFDSTISDDVCILIGDNGYEYGIYDSYFGGNFELAMTDDIDQYHVTVNRDRMYFHSCEEFFDYVADCDSDCEDESDDCEDESEIEQEEKPEIKPEINNLKQEEKPEIKPEINNLKQEETNTMKNDDNTTMKNIAMKNKTAATQAAFVEAGKIANNQIIKLIKPKLPMVARGYAEHPVVKLAIANAVSIAIANYRSDDANAKQLADSMVFQAYQELISSIDIEGMLDEFINTPQITKSLKKLKTTDEE